MTPQILGNIKSYGIERVAGFSSLREEDRARVRLALKNKRIDPGDVTGAPPLLPPTSQPSQATATQPPAVSPRKRKADTEPGPSRVENVAAPSPTQAAARQAAIGGTAWEEGADAEDFVDQQVDELYGALSSNVVGVQYYNGTGVSPLNMNDFFMLTFAW